MKELLQQSLNALVYHTQQTRPIENTQLAIDALRKAILSANDTWQPIETAPKFSDEIDIWANGERHVNCAFGGNQLGWIYESHPDGDGPVYEIVKNPTHWMPLPKPPADPTSAPATPAFLNRTDACCTRPAPPA